MFEYDECNYINTHTSINLKCKCCKNTFNVRPSVLLRKNSRGCTFCSGVINYGTTKWFIEKAIKIHGDLYSYEHTDYINAKTSVNITCSIHGIVQVNPITFPNHGGCPKCGYATGWGFKKSRFVAKYKDQLTTFYIILIYNNNEQFVKVGITGTTVEKRFIKPMPYNYKILRTYINLPGSVWDKELEMKRKLTKFKHIPKIKFEGWTECFNYSEVKNILNL